ncbi:MAG: redox-regulated ATPase YchF [Aquificota bacterium]|nr:redox-regulated ATPase YchF [Aquificaceae bacterium]MDM7266821.1 redox-regulated ATPase YchF [Aquificaceae bacterium]QWK13543.1 MAG: redox-regulated ATPase YchF [Aquificota bacterium]HCO39806.1 redox-regulated ATPase YchF [Aquificaceae bacterium]
MLSVGIVGLPNVGKSTLFNALIQAAKAAAANYPFCTIEPNVGTVEVPDKRLYEIARLERSKRVVPTFIEFVDIAGLVRNASKGEGLGNQFLAHIREVDAIAMVLRCFENPEVVHVEGSVDPIRDAQIIDLELIAKDLETVEKRMEKVEKMARIGDKKAKEELNMLESIRSILEKMEPIRRHAKNLDPEVLDYAKRNLFLLTAKPLMYVANVSEKDLPEGNEFSKRVFEYAKEEGSPAVLICAKLEEELIGLEPEEKEELLKSYGLEEPGLNRLIREAYKLLDLITFFTAGEKETRAWTVKKGTKAPQAAGKIHSDFERGFIAAEVINYEDYIKVGSLSKAKELGLVRLEGKDYEIKDGDIVYFRFNV